MTRTAQITASALGLIVSMFVLLSVLVGCESPPRDPPPAGDEPADTCDPWPVLQRGTGARDEVRALAMHDGKIIVAGYEGGGTSGRFELDGPAAGYIAAYDVDGALAWELHVDANGADSIDVLLADEHALLVAGRVSEALPGFTAQGQFDAFLGRVDDATLTILWQGGDETPQAPRRLARDGDGLIVSGSNELYVPSNYVERWSDSRVDRLRPAQGGGYETDWTHLSTSMGSDDSYGLWVGGDGALLLAGVGDIGANHGAWVQQLAPGGTVGWQSGISHIGYDSAMAIIEDASRLRVVGSTFLTLGEAAYGDQDVYVAEIEPGTGALGQAVQYGSAATDWATDAILAPDGRLLVVGETAGAIVPGAVVRGGYDLFALAFDAEGNVVAAWQGGTEGADHANAVMVDDCGRVLVAGWTTDAWEDASHLGERDGFVIEARLEAVAVE